MEEINEQPPAPTRRPSSRYASTALFVGVVSVVASFAVIGGVIGIGAIVVGVRALRQLRTADRQVRGRGMAAAGILLGVLSILASITALALYLFVPLLARARYAQEVAGTVNRMRMVLAAAHQYAADNNDFLPPSLTPLVTYYGLKPEALRDVRNALPPATAPAAPDLDWEKYDAAVQAHCDFVYTGEGLRLTLPGPAHVMVLFAKRLAGKDRLIGFADGHVERIPPTEWPRIVEATDDARLQRHRQSLPPPLLDPTPQ